MTDKFPFQNLPQIWNLIRNFNEPIKLVWIGLGTAGKSSLIKRLKTGEFYNGIPRTMGLTVDKLFYESESNLEIISWDLGGQDFFREHLWKDYLKGASAIIYVLDNSKTDDESFSESKNELWNYVLSSKATLETTPVLILANKSDLETTFDLVTLKKRLGLKKIKKGKVQIFLVSALSGLNLDKAFLWLMNSLLEMKNRTK